MTAEIQKALLVGATLGFVACGLGLWVDPKAVLASYLAAWFAMSAIPIGAIGVLYTTYLVRGGWTRDLNDSLTAAALATPISALLFIPIAAGLAWIYPWASDPGALTPFKAIYLTPAFFIGRAVIYFGILTGLAVWGARAFGNDAAMLRAASAGLIVWSLTVSWAGIDWLESIEPDFHSSIYGLLSLGFVLLAGLAFPMVALFATRRPRQMGNAAYAGVLLSTLLLWAYLHAMQYIIIWTGNIPDEVEWYLERLEGGWGFVLWALFFGQFILPFFALLSERVRGSTAALLWIAGLTLVFRLVESIVLTLPPLHIAVWSLAFGIVAASLAVGCSALLAFHAAAPVLQRWSGRVAASPQRQQSNPAA